MAEDIEGWLNCLHTNSAVNLVLTKRPERWGYLTLPPLLWYGITCCTAFEFEKCSNFYYLPQPAARWLSVEPLLEDVRDMLLAKVCEETTRPDWVVVGCESGPKRSPCNLEWVRGVVEVCVANGVPVFVKQLDLDGKCVTDINAFPADLQIRQVPWLSCYTCQKLNRGLRDCRTCHDRNKAQTIIECETAGGI